MQPNKPANPQRALHLDVRQVMDQLHSRYNQAIAEAFQSNAELTIGLDNAQARIAELEAQVEAMRGARAVPAGAVAVPQAQEA